jgi:hypothetical protein
MLRDLTNQQSGRLKVVRFIGTRGRNSYWECVCSCGKTISVRRDHLIGGAAKSCGCYQAQLNQQAAYRKQQREQQREQQKIAMRTERAERAQKIAEYAAQTAQRKAEREKKREEKRIAKLRRTMYSPRGDINPQIAAVIRHLRGHVKRREVAHFFDVKPEKVSAIWKQTWLPQSDLRPPGWNTVVSSLDLLFLESVFDCYEIATRSNK